MRTHVALHDALDPADGRRGRTTTCRRRPPPPWPREGFAAGAAPVRPHRRPALLRPGLRGPGRRCPTARSTQPLLDEVAAPFHAEHRGLYGYDFAGDPRQQVEWVNLRVSGIGPIQRPEIARAATRPRRGRPRRTRQPRRSASTPPTATSTTPVYWRADLAPGDVVDGPAVIEEFGSTVPLHPGFAAAVDALPQPDRAPGARQLDERSRGADPVPVRRPHRRRRRGRRPGAGRDRRRAASPRSRWRSRPRSRAPPQSPMIRDAHDFRAGIHDRLLRKLTGRSYSALVHPVARDFPLEEMRAGRRVLPQRRLPLRGRHRAPARPVRDGAGVPTPDEPRSSRSCRPSATTTTSAARCPGSMPSARDQRLRGGADGAADPALGRRACPTARRWRS